LADFKKLKRKTVRVIVYKGNNRVETIREHEEKRAMLAALKEL